MHNAVNEISTRDTDSNSSVNYTLVHDAVGNMTDDNQSYKLTYDVFGRLRKIKNQSNNLVAEYTYNGLGFRTGWHYDVDADATVENTSDDPWFYFCHDERWRMVATYRADDFAAAEPLADGRGVGPCRQEPRVRGVHPAYALIRSEPRVGVPIEHRGGQCHRPLWEGGQIHAHAKNLRR